MRNPDQKEIPPGVVFKEGFPVIKLVNSELNPEMIVEGCKKRRSVISVHVFQVFTLENTFCVCACKLVLWFVCGREGEKIERKGEIGRVKGGGKGRQRNSERSDIARQSENAV